MPKKSGEQRNSQDRPEMVALSRSFRVDRVTAEACWEVNRGNKTAHTTNRVKQPDSDHPDAGVLRKWLIKESKDSSEFEIVFRLCHMVRSEWEMLPKRTKSEHRHLYLGIASLCNELRIALDGSGGGLGWGLRRVNIGHLLNDAERSTFPEETEFPGFGSKRSLKGCFPNVEELLERLGSEASNLADQRPLHTQPRKRGAERGYFVRRIAELLDQRYGKQPHEVIAALATITLGEATDRELVAKLLK